jgi:hypothetical protein
MDCQVQRGREPFQKQSNIEQQPESEPEYRNKVIELLNLEGSKVKIRSNHALVAEDSNGFQINEPQRFAA